MGQCVSKGSRKVEKTKKEKEAKDIPLNSPLGEMFENWDKDKNLKNLDKIKMIRYSVEIWSKECIEKGPVYRPWYGSKEKWLCAALNKHVKLKGLQNEEEIKYANCWLQSEMWDKKIRVYKVSKESEKGKEEIVENK